MFQMTWRSPESGAAHHTLELPMLLGCPERASPVAEARQVSRSMIPCWSRARRMGGAGGSLDGLRPRLLIGQSRANVDSRGGPRHRVRRRL